MNQPLVSVIVPTYNSAEFIDACLRSITEQDYPHIELIVVDNYSTDATTDIAKKYTDKVYTLGPERSAQRNYGVKQSAGEYLLIIDSDMELTLGVVASCIETAKSTHAKAVIIPEESFGIGFWAQCKALERSFYVGVDWMEAARFFDKKVYLAVGGYDESMISGEDWDLSQRVAALGKITRTQQFIRHNEGRLQLSKTLRKKYYYAKHFSLYTAKSENVNNMKNQTGIFTRYLLFLRQPTKLFRNPLVGVGMLVMKTGEFFVGGIGYLSMRTKRVPA